MLALDNLVRIIRGHLRTETPPKLGGFYRSLTVVSFIVTAILLIFVVPTFEDLFKGFGADLPAFTQMVINMSRFMQDWWWAIFGGIGLVIYGFSELKKRSRAFNRSLDRIVLSLPVIGAMMHKAAIARFARTLGTMSAAGVPLVEALGSVAGATGNIVYSTVVLKIREEVATGQQLQQCMKAANLFPNIVIQMVAIGEESGSLDSMLEKVADFFEEEVDNAVDSLSTKVSEFKQTNNFLIRKEKNALKEYNIA